MRIGGGGTPYPHFIRIREMMRNGAVVRIISPEDVKDDDVVACGGGKGSPTVGMEKLPANEYVERFFTLSSPTMVSL